MQFSKKPSVRKPLRTAEPTKASSRASDGRSQLTIFLVRRLIPENEKSTGLNHGEYGGMKCKEIPLDSAAFFTIRELFVV